MQAGGGPQVLEETFLVTERELTRKLVARGRQSGGLRARERLRSRAREQARSGEELAERGVIIAGNGAEMATWHANAAGPDQTPINNQAALMR